MFNQVFMSTQSQKPHNTITYVLTKGDEEETFITWRALTMECRDWRGVSEHLHSMLHTALSYGDIPSDSSLFSWQYDNIEEALKECGWTVTKRS